MICNIINWLIRNFYDLLKDLIIPGLVLFFTIRYSFIIAKRQLNSQKKHDEESENLLNVINHHMVTNANTSLLSEISLILKSLNSNKQQLNFRNFQHLEHFVINKSAFRIIPNIGFDKLYKIYVVVHQKDGDIFLKYWKFVSELEDQVRHIEKYNSYVYEEYNAINEKLNNLLSKIAVEVSNYIHDVVPPFTTINFSMEELKYSHTELSIYCLDVHNKFVKNSEYLSPLENNESLLTGLDEIRTLENASKVISSEFVQDLRMGIGYIENLKKLLKVSGETYDSFIKYFEKCELEIKNF